MDLEARVSKIKMIILDVDGTLTDGGIILGPGIELKRFDVQDGMGIALARSVGLAIGIITGRRSTVVEDRAAELGITDLYQGIGDKNEILDQILLEKSLLTTLRNGSLINLLKSYKMNG